MREADPESPYRCQGKGQGAEGQCRFLSLEGLVRGGYMDKYTLDAVEGIDKCERCGGVAKASVKNKETVKRYRIEGLKEQIRDQLTNGDAFDLAEELALSRAVLERILHNISDTFKTVEFLAYVPLIERSTARIESLAVTCQKLMDKSNTMMSPEQAIKYADELLQIIIKYVPENLRSVAAEEMMNKLDPESDS